MTEQGQGEQQHEQADQETPQHVNGGATPPDHRPKKKEGKKPRRYDTLLDLAGAMRRSPGSTFHMRCPFPELFRVIQDPEGLRRPVRLSADNVVTRAAPEAVIEAVSRYAAIALSDKSPKLMPHDCKVVYDFWRAHSIPLDENRIAPVAEKNQTEPKYTWHRLPFDIKIGPTPTFDAIMARTTNHKALMAWIGSLITPGTSRSQYLYIYGKGGTGKGRFASFLARLFGEAFRSDSAAIRNQFWTSRFVGARLVCFPDLDDSSFLSSGLFKSLTGEDPICIEPKGQPSYTTRLHAKFLILSNSRPEIGDDEANRRRALFCEMVPLPEGTQRIATSKLDEMLWRETPAWLAKCKEAFVPFAANGSEYIEADNLDVIQEIVDEHQRVLLDLRERYFDLGPGFHTTSQEMQEILRHEKFNYRDQHQWFLFLEDRYKIKRQRLGTGNDRSRSFPGLRVNTIGRNKLEFKSNP